MTRKNIVYGIDSKPKLTEAIPLGLQHVLTLFGATTLVPLILGGAIFGNDYIAVAHFIGNIYITMGIATLLQLYIGSGLPIVQGSSFAFIVPILAVVANLKCNKPDISSSELMQYISGALIVGGLAETVIGYSGLVGKLKKIISPVVMGPTIMLIGFSLFDVAVNFNAANYWPVSLLVVACIFIFSLVIKGKTRLFPILISLILVYLLCLFLSMAGIFNAEISRTDETTGKKTEIVQKEHPAYVNMEKVKDSEWFQASRPFRYGWPKFDISSIIVLLIAFLVSMIESIGDYHSVSYASGLDDPSDKTISKGIGSEGLGCIIGGIFGGSGATSYTENIGLINLTGVASRYVVAIGSVILIILSFFAKLGALISTMPSPIIGGAYIALFGIIGALGIQVLTRCDLNSQRNLMIIGLSFFLGLGIGFWMKGYAGSPGFSVRGAEICGDNQTLKYIWDVVSNILSSHMAVGAILALLLDNIIPGTLEERGIKGGSAE